MAAVHIEWNPSSRTLRQFGLIGVAVFGVLAAVARARWGLFKYLPPGAAGPTALAMIVLAAYCGVAGMLSPRLLRPLYVGLCVLFFPVGVAVSYLMLAVMYYGVITPIALVFKLIGRDAMNRRFDVAAPTYWIRRQPPTSVARYFRQF